MLLAADIVCCISGYVVGSHLSMVSGGHGLCRIQPVVFIASPRQYYYPYQLVNTSTIRLHVVFSLVMDLMISPKFCGLQSWGSPKCGVLLSFCPVIDCTRPTLRLAVVNNSC
ncbi:hypothetical protein QTP88_026313 [Uroleucon formosanum]